MKIEILHEFDTDNFLQGLDLVDRDEVANFIFEINSAMEDWDFTETLYKHFASEMKKLKDDEAL